jgi:hypothetical protein
MTCLDCSNDTTDEATVTLDERPDRQRAVRSSLPALVDAVPCIAAGAGRELRSGLWRAFMLLLVAYFITIVDFTIANVALPTIGRDLHSPSLTRRFSLRVRGVGFVSLFVRG